MSEREYRDFDLAIEQLPEGGYRARVLDSPSGQARHDFTMPFSPLELENFVLKIGRTRSGVRRLESPEAEAARTFGRRLFEAVFAGEVETTFRRSLDAVERDQRGLRMRLRLADAPDLSEIPWEYLYVPSDEHHLVLSTWTPLVRYLDMQAGAPPLTIQPPLRMLAMVSSPSDFPTLDIEAEWAKLDESLDPLEESGLLEVTRLDTATLRDLQRAMRRTDFHIFHFIGHGGFDREASDGVLMLESDDGRGRKVTGRELGTILHDSRSIRLAVLNACEGARSSIQDPLAGAAQSLVARGIPAVVAMQFEISDRAAIVFAHELYSAVADGFPIDAALAEARRAIFGSGNDIEWGTPVLYMRTDDGHLFDLLPTDRPGTGGVASALTATTSAALTEMPAWDPVTAGEAQPDPEPDRPAESQGDKTSGETPVSGAREPSEVPAASTATTREASTPDVTELPIGSPDAPVDPSAPPTTMPPPLATAPPEEVPTAEATTGPPADTEPTITDFGITHPAVTDPTVIEDPTGIDDTVTTDEPPVAAAPPDSRPVVRDGATGRVAPMPTRPATGDATRDGPATPPAPPPGGPKRSGMPGWMLVGLGVVLALLGWWAFTVFAGGDEAFDPGENDDAQVEVEGDAVAFRAGGSPRLDGDPGEWIDVPVFEATSAVFGDPGGAAVTIGKWRLAWDDEALYVLVETDDRAYFGGNAADPVFLFRGDSASFEFGPDPAGLDDDTPTRPGDRHVMLGVPSDETGGDVVGAVNPSGEGTFVAGPDRSFVGDIRGTVAVDPGEGYTIEAAIPWSVLGVDDPQPGMVFGANLNVSDANEADGSLRLMLSTNPDRSADHQSFPATWNTLVLDG